MASPDRVYRFLAGAGYPATRRTVQLLGKMALQGAQEPALRERVRHLFRGLPSMDIDGEIEAVWRHVLEGVRYQRDPVGAEHLTDPLVLDGQVDEGDAAEDCESIAAYAATLLAAAGYASLFEIQGRQPSRPDRFTHCALRVLHPRRREAIAFDPVGAQEIPGFGLGDTLHLPGQPIEWWTLDGRKVDLMRNLHLTSRCSERNLEEALLGDVDTEQVIRAVVSGVKTAAGQLGPYGQLAAGLIQVGEDIVDLATGKVVGKPLPKVPPKGVNIPPPPPAVKAPGFMLERGDVKFTPPTPPTEESSGAGAAVAVAGGIGLLKLLAVI